jgi:hypothetical protein
MRGSSTVRRTEPSWPQLGVLAEEIRRAPKPEEPEEPDVWVGSSGFRCLETADVERTTGLEPATLTLA